MARWPLMIAIRLLVFAICFASALLKNHVHRQPVAHGQSVDKVATGRASTRHAQTPAYDFIEGRYANFNYAYSVLVPKGMVGATSPAPLPQHGFGINLLNPSSGSLSEKAGWPKAYLWVDGSYNALMWNSFQDVIDENLRWAKEKYPRVRLIRRDTTHLGRLPAVRFVMAYGDAGEEMIEDQIISIRHQSDIIYSINLCTPLSRYDVDKLRVVEMQRTWVIDPLPDDYPVLPPDENTNP